MKFHLCFSLVAVALFILACGPDARDKFKKSGGGGGGGTSISSEDQYRALQTNLVLEHVSLVKQSLELTKPSASMLKAKCKTITPHPGENPFLEIDYFNCAVNIPGSKSQGRITGVEYYSLEANKIVISAPDLSLTAYGKQFIWAREITISAKSIDDLMSADGIRFHLKESITPTEKSTLNKWSINILGRAKFSKNGVDSFSNDLRATVVYVRPVWIPAKKAEEGFPAKLFLKAQTDTAFRGSCSRPVSRFMWEATEGRDKGIIETSEQGVTDPEKNDPVYQKPAPWPKCE